MRFDLMTTGGTWARTADLASDCEAHDFSGMVFTEQSQTPWMSIAAASIAAPTLEFATGIAVAFPRSPIISAGLAWELADNTGGRFRLGLGSQVRAHIERRYGVEFDPPGPRLREYVQAVRACFRAFAGEEPLQFEGRWYRLTLLPAEWAPRRHTHGDIKIDISAVNPWMVAMAGEVADGIHVHPLHSVRYLRERLLPAVDAGAARVGRPPSEVDLIVPVMAVPGDSAEERRPLLEEARSRLAFYGSTRAYSFQFDDIGFEGTSARLNERMKAGDRDGMSAVVTDEMLEHFAVVAGWDDMADALISRYGGLASRLVMYLGEQSIRSDPANLGRWGEIARAVTRSSAVRRPT